ncbi:cytochrome P450 2J6-like [Patiria miniata]|uniref:Cytochrome P450 n=1 Tax=Patiria miniata TaxID=46514 RepID=A0A914BIP4_PATMI|nr:cytochrome P450 2J6-like [Patiria miniata]
MGVLMNLLWFLSSVARAVSPFVLLFLVLRWFFRRSENLPPGPRELPFIGSLPAIVWGLMRRGLQPHHVLGRFAERYGPVFRVNLLNKTVVMLDDFKSTKAAFQHPQLNDRPPGALGKGVSGTSGEQWIEMRRFCLNVLRSFGVGKSSFEEKIGAEGEELLKEMSAFQGKPFNPRPPFGSAVSNVICSVVFGKRYDYEDQDFKRLLALLNKVILSSGTGGIVVFTKGFPRLPFFKSKLKRMRADHADIYAFIRRIIDSHRSELDPHNPSDFIDVYLMAVQRNASRNATPTVANGATAKPEKYSHLNETNLLYTVNDLFSAGSETTVTTMEWCLLYMAIHPEIQQRVQAEIDAVVGRNRLPRLADKPGLNLTRAVIWEVQRMASIVPLGLPHVAASDTQFQGFLIPKDTILVSNLWRINRDPKLWPEPEKFKPERFLNDEGKAFKPEEFIPFGVGRRICLGEHLAKMELFIFFSYFMHQFTFQKPADAPPYTLEGKSSITFSPLPFEICAVKRD